MTISSKPSPIPVTPPPSLSLTLSHAKYDQALTLLSLGSVLLNITLVVLSAVALFHLLLCKDLSVRQGRIAWMAIVVGAVLLAIVLRSHPFIAVPLLAMTVPAYLLYENRTPFAIALLILAATSIALSLLRSHLQLLDPGYPHITL